MSPDDASQVFDSLSAKQHATLTLAARHLTSKQIAIQLGVAPITIDKRIDVVRSKLDAIPRADLLRLYGDWRTAYSQTIHDPTILPEEGTIMEGSAAQSEGFAFTFEDSLRLDDRSFWDRDPRWLQTGWKPSDLGVGGKLLVMLAGAVAIMVVAVLSVAFANALMTMITR